MVSIPFGRPSPTDHSSCSRSSYSFKWLTDLSGWGPSLWGPTKSWQCVIVHIYLNHYFKYTLGVNGVKGADQGQSFPRAVSMHMGMGSWIFISATQREPELHLNDKYLSHRFHLLKLSDSGWKDKAVMQLHRVTAGKECLPLKYEFQHSETKCACCKPKSFQWPKHKILLFLTPEPKLLHHLHSCIYF